MMMPDAERRRRCTTLCVVGCRRAAEIGVDLPKGSETLLIFHVLPLSPTVSSVRLHPFPFSLIRRLARPRRKAIAYPVNTRSFEMQMANCVKINYTPLSP